MGFNFIEDVKLERIKNAKLKRYAFKKKKSYTNHFVTQAEIGASLSSAAAVKVVKTSNPEYGDVITPQDCDSTSCKICYAEKATVALIPCGHMMGCNCFNRIIYLRENCYWCRSAVDNVLRVYS